MEVLINKFSKLFIAISLLCIGVLRLDIEKEVSATTDYSSQVVVNDWDIIDDGGEALSKTNGTTFMRSHQYKITWTLAPLGDVLHTGDTLNLPLPKNSQTGGWSMTESAYVDFTDATGTVIGQWRVYNGKIEVIFGENAEGVSSVTPTFISGANAIFNGTLVTADLIQDVSVGGVSKPIKFLKTSQSIMASDTGKSATSASNNRINWFIYVNRSGVTELTQHEWGTNFTIKNDVYVEDTIEEGASIKNISMLSHIFLPTDLTTGSPGSMGASAVSITSFFTKIEQSSAESYASFKARLAPLEYGIYTDTSGIETFVANYGDIGSNGIKYSDANSNFAKIAASGAIKNGFYLEEDRAELEAYFEKVYGDGNVINGNVSNIQVYLNVEYNKVLRDTPKTNTAQLTTNGVSRNLVGAATLQGNIGTASVASSAAGLYLYDEETGVLLQGGTFKLQYDNNGLWQDHSPTGILTTDEEGFVQTPTLGAGTYRFVQLSASDEIYNLPASQGYDSSLASVLSEEFTIDPLNSEGELVEVSNIKHRYDVVYQAGEYGMFEDNEHLDVVALSATPAYSGELCEEGTPLGEEGYVFVGWDKEVSPFVTSSAVYVAQWEEVSEQEPVSPPNPDPTKKEVPDGGLAANPLGILAVFISAGVGLIYRLRK